MGSKQAERSQAYNDIFGRAAASRPSISSSLRGPASQRPPGANVGPSQGYSRPQSYYGYPVTANGPPGPAGFQTGEPYRQGPPQPVASTSSAGYYAPAHPVAGPSYPVGNGMPPARHHHAPLAPAGTPGFDVASGAAGMNQWPHPQQRYASSSSSQHGVMPPSPGLPPASQFQQSFTSLPTIPAGVQVDSSRSSSLHASAATSAASSISGSHGQGTPAGPRAPRLPSLDMTGEYNWFGQNEQNANQRGGETNTSTPSAGSALDEVSPGIEALSVSERDYTTSSGARSYASSRVTTPAEGIRNSYQAQYNSEYDSGHRDSPASANSGSDSTNHQYFPLTDREHAGQRLPLGPREPFEGFAEQYPAGYVDARQQQVQQQQRGGGRTSFESDMTSIYAPHSSSDNRTFYASGPSSNSTHSGYYPNQSQPGPYPPSGPGHGYQSLGPGQKHPQISPQHSQYAPHSSLHHSSSRKSAESVRVYPTQPKPQSAYQDRAFSFSGSERPDHLFMRPSSQSPRPTSSISEIPFGIPGESPSGQLAQFPGRSPSYGQGYHSGPGGSSSHGHHNSQSRHGHSDSIVRQRGPIVYPALLSRVADSFKARVILAERTKDGLSYKDAFDGREAVDRIANIIRTTDRNLALLLGRALDAQKFFHDVTYEHRLRDSPHELYQFRERLHTGPYGAPAGPGDASQAGHQHLQAPRPPSPTDTMLSDEGAAPIGVFTLLTDCYSPTCTRDRLCYSIACPRRLEQQARLNMKIKPGLKEQTPSEEQTLGDDDRLGYEPGMLWIQMVAKEISDSVDDTEKRRQEAINELIYTERDFVRDMEYLRDKWMLPLRTGPTIPEAQREAFVHQVFWNVTEIHDVNIKLAEALTRRQKQQPVVHAIGDLLLKAIPDFGPPFVKYGAHQLYGKYEFEKEKGSNPAFLKFVETTERLPESRKLELNGYLTKPTTRLARYPLLLEAILKSTPDDNPDKQNIPKAVKLVRELLGNLNHESGRTEARFNLAQLAQQLVFRPGEAVDLKLRDESRDLIFKGPLKKRGGTQSESAELQVFLFDHAVLMVKAKGTNKNEQLKVYRKPIPLELLVVSTTDDPTTLRNSTARPKSLMSRTSNVSKLNLSTNGKDAKQSVPEPTSKMGFPITFNHLGRKGYQLTLWSPTHAGRKKWIDKIVERQTELRERSMVFESSVLSEGYFLGPNRVNCAAPYDGGTRMVFGTDNGVYMVNLLAAGKAPVKVLSCTYVTQVDVLEDYGTLVVLADKAVQTFLIEGLTPDDAVGAAKRARKISTNASFFKTGVCLNRTLVCIVKSGTVSSTIKTLEPIDHHGRSGKKQPTIRKLLQGGNELLRVYKEFYIPTESSSVHFLKSKLCVGCTKGFEIVDLDTLDTQGLLDPADSSLDFVQKRESARPLAIYRVDGDFLLCYDEFAFYVNKNGWRARSNWLVQWEGSPTAFALHYPYVLAFDPTFVEVRHVDSGALMQIIPGISLRLLFADTPPSSSAALAAAQNNPNYPYPYNPHIARQSSYGQHSQYSPPVRLPGPRKQVIYTSDNCVLTLRETA